MRAFFCLFALLATAHADIVTDVRISLESQAFTQADTQLATYRAQHGVTPEYLDAHSWMGRAYLKSNNLDQANTHAHKTEQLVLQQLKTRKLDADPHLPNALGAAIEMKPRSSLPKALQRWLWHCCERRSSPTTTPPSATASRRT